MAKRKPLTRRQALGGLRSLIRPKLYASGYGPPEAPLRLVIRRGAEPIPVPRALSLRDFSGRAVQSILGFTADGVITDAHLGIVTQAYSQICLEDLRRVLAAARKVRDWANQTLETAE